MRLFTLITASFLCCIGWISVSESRTVDAQSGGDVTLLCSNISQETTQTDWFRLINGTKATCVSSMYRPDGPTSFCKGFEHGFEMSTNVTMIFLKIKRVNLSDSGFYFCGFYRDQHTVIAETTYLNVQGDSESDELEDSDRDYKGKGPSSQCFIFNVAEAHVMFGLIMSLVTRFSTIIFIVELSYGSPISVILGLTVFMVPIVIVVIVVMQDRQKAINKEQQPEGSKSQTARRRRLASDREVGTYVMYTVSR
ncbi:uncharacterized protein LOC115059185 isoform X1 [Echeneis naucrates]|uniref:uncharacterized protein LOC115059185 isoform X1 n=1 Tax=Echeneis naucrates TaxID=173247 RepID=UPI001113B9D7|nr:uncharacterized protein LOC115059185 isoform X1 [Echeneis naucrates]